MKPVYTKLEDFSAWELEAYADGEAIPHLATYVQKHPAEWQQWLQQNQHIQRLATILYRFDCPAVETLQAYFWDELATTARQHVTAHLAICPRCTDELANLRMFMGKKAAAPSVKSTIEGQQPRWLDQIQNLVGQMRLVVAQLVTPVPQLAGVALRSTPAALRQEQNATLLFEAENTDISLTLQKERNATFALAGQIFLAEPTEIKATVRLASEHANTEIIISDIPETGSFMVHAVPPGDYQMVIVFPNQAIVIPHLALHE